MNKFGKKKHSFDLVKQHVVGGQKLNQMNSFKMNKRGCGESGSLLQNCHTTCRYLGILTSVLTDSPKGNVSANRWAEAIKLISYLLDSSAQWPEIEH